MGGFLVSGTSCGLGLTGTGTGLDGDDAGPSPVDATVVDTSLPGAPTSPDAPVPSDARPDVDATPPPVDAGVDTADACGPIVVIDDDFSGGISGAWTKMGSATATPAGGANGPFVTLTTLTNSEQAALLFETAEPLGTFAASFQFFLNYGLSTSVADGLAFGWFDRANGFGALVGGKGLGLPKNAGGYALAVDTNQNTELNDPQVPYFGVVTLDAGSDPGTVDWHVASSLPSPLLAIGGWHSVVAVVRAGSVTVTVDGILVLSSVRTTPLTNGAFGFTAATGGGNAVGASIDTVRVVLPNPACPGAFP